MGRPCGDGDHERRAVSGLVGIGQYAILNYNLDQRPHGTLGMYDLLGRPC
jgi:hypothetical protein